MAYKEIYIERAHYDPVLTLLPSYNYPLVKGDENKFRIICGKLRGAQFIVEGKLLKYRGMSLDTLLDITGLWYDPEREAKRLTRKYKMIFDSLYNVYKGLGLSINRLDRDLIFIASYLSRNTSFHNNVVKWLEFLCRCGTDENCIRLAHNIFRSYQFDNLVKALSTFKSIKRRHSSIKYIDLMMLKNIGVKTYLAFSLFSSRVGKNFAPPDVNFLKMTRKLGIFEKFILPKKELCIKYLIYGCRECPIRDLCIVKISRENFKGLAGWIQTAFYLHTKLFCKKKLCHKCSLKDECTES